MLPSGREALLSDTVGFITDLPPQLIKAFKVSCTKPQLHQASAALGPTLSSTHRPPAYVGLESAKGRFCLVMSVAAGGSHGADMQIVLHLGL